MKKKPEGSFLLTNANLKPYLLYCQYEVYCQGFEDEWGYFLVYANSQEEAERKLKDNIEGVQEIEHKTIF